MNRESSSNLLNKRTVRAILAVSARTLDNYTASGRLGYVKIGKAVRFIAADVESFVRQRRIGSEKEPAPRMLFSTISGKVYILRCGRFTKVGISSNPEERCKEIQASCPEEVTMLFATGEIDDALEVEQKIHAKYKEKRVRGEWFHLSEAEIIYLIGWLGLRSRHRGLIRRGVVEDFDFDISLEAGKLASLPIS